MRELIGEYGQTIIFGSILFGIIGLFGRILSGLL